MNTAKKGTWVRVHNIVLTPEQRAPQVPDDTKKVPLEMWVKGNLLNDAAKIGDTVQVETLVGRVVEGTMIEIEPRYVHDYGNYVNEIAYIGKQLRSLLAGGAENGER
jgi:hypothetical protein